MRGTSRFRKKPTSLIVTAVAFALGLSGCASLAPQPQSFDLHAAQARARSTSGRIFVTTASAIPPLDGDLIVVRGADGSLSRVPDARWVDRLPPLLQSRLAQTFENAGLARQVSLSGEGAQYSLAMEIRRFDIDSATRTAHVELTARLAQAGGQTVAAKVFSATEPVADIAGAASAHALDGALGIVLAQIVGWAAASSR
ncbi:ABC-type transport auxiliary lipoprotein family protein [Rhodoblastus sp.]|mgnify:CR=1 FL=1|jgi:cholesterol transport system auxiliary component|uniref:ABC-type transport auxiliary lipoprotein family protein n=1 Tax=Rhodoblastus sp. TaxID=1962975 RepID=UPI0025E779A6|nr:ABC-type transport auxiliary lipoprotein family protein [Rhodoblastus sp.]